MYEKGLILSCPQTRRDHVRLPVVLASLLIGSAVGRWLGATYVQLLLTAVVTGVGLLFARRNLAAARQFPKTAHLNLVVTAVWAGCSFLLIWTGMRSELLVWRLAWLALMFVLGLTHLLALHVAASGLSGFVKRVASGSVGALAVLLMYPAFTVRFPSLPGSAYLWVVVFPAAGTVFGAIATWGTRTNAKIPYAGASTWSGMQWISLSQLALIVLGVGIGRASSPQREAIVVRPSALVDLSRRELSAQLDVDLHRVQALDSEVTDLVRQMEGFQKELAAKFTAEQRDYYLPHEGTQMRSLFRRFLSCRASLLRIVASYAGLDELQDPRMRARCFMLGLAAAMRTYESSVRIVFMYRDHVLARRTMNESQRQHGLDGGMFDWVYESVTSERNVHLASRMAERYARHRQEWQVAQVWPASAWSWLDHCIDAALDYIRKHPIDQRSASMDLFLRRLADQAYGPLYDAQSTLAEWMGDTRMVDQLPAINREQITDIESALRPGDILLQRREWYLGNAFLPGFWSHAALYIGGIEDLRRLGIADQATVQEHLPAFLAPTSGGSDRTVIEALSEGVVFNSLPESLHADFVAVLRPNLPDRQIARAIINAFEYHGRPYDFEFDFATEDKLVCTELVYRAYQGMLHFDLVRIMGRNTLPAAEIARKYARERQDPQRELDLLLYYGMSPTETSARRRTEQAFVATIDSSALAAAGGTLGGQ